MKHQFQALGLDITVLEQDGNYKELKELEEEDDEPYLSTDEIEKNTTPEEVVEEPSEDTEAMDDEENEFEDELDEMGDEDIEPTDDEIDALENDMIEEDED